MVFVPSMSGCSQCVFSFLPLTSTNGIVSPQVFCPQQFSSRLGDRFQGFRGVFLMQAGVNGAKLGSKVIWCMCSA